ncbi:MAG: hypothetical protein KC547_14455 [Anaerolineae bacterium]|nr:hypothetical protein [Anaerolineae bacterium]
MAGTPAPPESHKSDTNAFAFFSRLLRSILANIAVVVAILTVIGFAVIQGYLARVTDLVTLNVDVRQYLIAGMVFVTGFPRIFQSSTIIEMLPLLGQFALYLAIFVGYELACVLFNIDDQPHKKASPFGRVEKVILRYVRIFLRLCIIIVAFMGLYLVGTIFGFIHYSDVPTFLGGAQSSTVILVFDEPQTDAGWPFAINPANPRQTQPIEMLMPLTDGVLVRDPQNPVPVIVKSDIIRAIIDANPRRQPVPTVTATPTAAPTETPTP